MKRTCYVTIYDGLYYRVDFLGQYDTPEAATVICHENQLTIYISNWIQSGTVSNKVTLGVTSHE